MLQLLLGAAIACAPATLHAAVDSTLQMEVRAYFQQNRKTSGDTQKGKVGIIRLDAKQLLALVEDRLDENFPRGSRLKLATSGKVTVVDSTGRTLADASRYLKVRYGTDKRVFDGNYNPVTGAESTRSYYPIDLKIKLGNLRGVLRGTAIEETKAPAPDGDGIQIVTGLINADVNGRGRINGGVGYFEGEIILEGREVFVRK